MALRVGGVSAFSLRMVTAWVFLSAFSLIPFGQQWLQFSHDPMPLARRLVVPARPAGTEGWSEEQLRELVTRDGMIGCAAA